MIETDYTSELSGLLQYKTENTEEILSPFSELSFEEALNFDKICGHSLTGFVQHAVTGIVPLPKLEKAETVSCLVEETEPETEEELVKEEFKTPISVRGRPRKNRDVSTSEFYSYLCDEMRKAFRKINSQSKNALN